MAKRYAPVFVTPAMGGRLMTGASSRIAGLFNYGTKREWRRDVDRESRAEGHDYFWPNTDGDFSSDPSNQPFPNEYTVKTALLAQIELTGWVVYMTFTEEHGFSAGELITVSGANESVFNGDFTITEVDKYWIKYRHGGFFTNPGLGATGTVVTKSREPITLVHYAEREDGKTAVVVGTKTHLFRFYAMDGGDVYDRVVEVDGDAVYERVDAGDASNVFDNNPGEWIVIGDGYSTEAKRWEAVNINGWTVFNNGQDLPCTYHLNERAVKPIYEMREAGVARVGTEAKFNDILMTGDISEIQNDEFANLMRPSGINPSGNFRATQAGTTVTAVGGTTESFFTAADVGKIIVWDDEDNTEVKVTAFVDAQNLTVDTTHTIAAPGQTFTFRVKATQAGSTYSGSITGTIAAAGVQVTSSAPIFNAGMVGDTLRFANGFSSVIAVFNGVSSVDLTDASPEAYTGMPFYLIDSATDYVVVADAAVFTADMVGNTLSWDDGSTRVIEDYTSPTQVEVDGDLPHASALIAIEKEGAYDDYESEQFVDRRQFRMLWSFLDYPRRFGPAYSGSIDASSNILVLDLPAKSISVGQELIVAGAGENGANLVASVIFVSADRIVTLDTLAITSVTSAVVQASDAAGAVTGFEDPKGDMSGILKMLTLGDFLMVYKDDSMILVSFTGNNLAPFTFSHEPVSNAKTLYFPHTLAAVGNASHIYAGSSSFYRVDLTNRHPVEIQSAELCDNVFFDNADLEDRHSIWAADNAMTKEIWFVVPDASVDKALCYDYLYGTFRTATHDITASATVKKPLVGETTGVAEDWYVMGTSDGVVLVYGRATEDVVSWGSVEAIYYRRNANPFSVTKYGYESVLKTGMSDFGRPDAEKHVDVLVPHLSSVSENNTFDLALLGARNTSEGETTLVSDSLPDPSGENLLPLHYEEMFFGCKITIPAVDGEGAQLVNNPLDLVGVSWGITNIDTRHWIRRSTAVVA